MDKIREKPWIVLNQASLMLGITLGRSFAQQALAAEAPWDCCPPCPMNEPLEDYVELGKNLVVS